MAESKSCGERVAPLEFDPTFSSSSNIIFPFKLPEDGLALRSARLDKDKPVLIFDAAPKVPTIQEDDVATVFRLVLEDKRPGFFYNAFPFFHPLHESRLFMQYSPAWLRWTGIGKLLAEVDWSMKCLHVGVRTNDEKTVYKSWQQCSQLQGLATHLDFPKDGLGPTIMSCEHARVEKGDNEIRFPEEPKMQITDRSSSLYSQYITENYRGVAYYDEPRFFKMQELIKLVLAVEWLHKEKGVRVNQEWMMMHTSKTTELREEAQLELSTRKMPPYNMVPRMEVFKRPSSDVTVKTREAEMYKGLMTHGVERRYGYLDFDNSEVTMFKEDGTKCLTQKSLKFSLNHTGLNSVYGWLYLPLPEGATIPEELSKPKDQLLQLLPKSAHREIISPMPMSVDTVVDVANDNSSDDSKLELKITESYNPSPPIALPPLKKTTTVHVTVSVDNYDELFANMDPNAPIQPEIEGMCEAIIPGVESWEELISELSVPLPRIWQTPFTGVGEPTAVGGVTTSSFPVRAEALMEQQVVENIESRHNYSSSGDLLMLRSVDVTEQGNSI
jgi:hypothetical protein